MRRYSEYNEYESGYRDGYESVMNEGIMDRFFKKKGKFIPDQSKFIPDQSDSKLNPKSVQDICSAFIDVQNFIRLSKLANLFPDKLKPCLYDMERFSISEFMDIFYELDSKEKTKAVNALTAMQIYLKKITKLLNNCDFNTPVNKG